MNTVSLVGTLTADPELGTGEAGIETCRMRIAVPRRSRDGRQEPGVVYADVTTFGSEARDCAARLSAGDRIGLSGRLERDDRRKPENGWEAEHGVLIDQIDFLDAPIGHD